ncbi:hypothetical protein GZ998_05300 [Actinomyces sp. 594]|uniref:hypothetical protein n=1 Tax=Actinomyces sp. 594 TaxID=2057793 RepID=UPI001C56CB98|nr:hypothetical protein [Actinomyces sp. 594]MBW3068928.1 hypothetical protein [Actinomyces sp. 594]
MSLKIRPTIRLTCDRPGCQSTVQAHPDLPDTDGLAADLEDVAQTLGWVHEAGADYCPDH